MALSKQEQFEKLLEQIDYADPHLTGGVIDQVVVHQQSRVWELHLHLREVLPLAVFTSWNKKRRFPFTNWPRPRSALRSRPTKGSWPKT